MTYNFKQTITFLGTNDLIRTAEFYEKVLGLELVRDQEVCRIYRCSTGGYLGFCSHLHIEETSDSIIMTLVCDDVDRWFEKLDKEGIQILKEPRHNVKFGIYHFFFRDPNGYLLEIQRFDEPL